MIIFKHLNLVLIVVLSTLLLGCGGGSSGGNNDTSMPVTPPPSGGNQEPESIVTLDSIPAGACGEFIEELNGVEFMRVKSCDESHMYEMAGTFELTEFADEYPGDIQIARLLNQGCRPVFESHTGQTYDAINLDIETISPSRSTWSEGDRTVICLVVNADRTPKTGSVGG